MTFLPLRKTVKTLAVVAFMGAPAMAQDTADIGQVLATVNGEEITLGHLIALRTSLPREYDQFDTNTLFTALLDQLVRQTLLAQESADDISKLTELTVENETRAIRSEEAARKIFQQEISEDEILAAYNTNFANAPAETEYNAAHILVNTEEEAADLIRQVQNGADFTQLAAEHSTGPSGPNGGDLGWFGAGTMVEPFYNATTTLQPGAVTAEPVQTQFGWHVILLKETRTAEQPSFETVRAELDQTLRAERFETHLAELEEQANVDRIDLNDFDMSVINNRSLVEN